MKIIDSLHFAENEWVYDVTESDDGTFLIRRYILDDEITDYYLDVYDSSLELVSEKSIIDKDIMNNQGTLFRGTVSDDDGSYYTVYSDAENEFTLFKYSSDDEVLYRLENITACLEGEYRGIFISNNGNPVVYSQASLSSSLYLFDELDSETGEVTQRYEITLEGGAQISEWYNLARGKSPDKYDFSYISGSSIYGCCLENEESALIADLSKDSSDSASLSACAVSENAILYAGENSEECDSGIYLCKSDFKGNIVSNLNADEFVENSNIRKIRTADNGDLWILVSQYSDETQKEIFFIVNTDTDLNIKKRINTEYEYIEDYIVDVKGRIAAYDSTAKEIVLCDSKGMKMFSKETSYGVYFFESGDGYYCADVRNETGKTVIYKIDFDSNNLKEINILDYTLEGVSDGYGKYDACFVFADGIYGYILNENRIEEIINWVDSDLDYQPDISTVIDSDTIVSRYFSYNAENSDTRLSVIRRVDDDTLKKIQERKVLTVAAGSLINDMRTLITDFNKNNDNYRIHVDDYSKYAQSELSFFYSSGLSALEHEVVKGNVPDMLIFGADFDMNRYIGFNAFADIDELLSGTDFKREEYFENVLDAYRVNGKQYAIPLSYKLLCLTGKKETIGDRTGFSVNEFADFNGGKNIFYGEPYYYLTDLMINANINEFIDTEKFTCSFNNEKFIKLLQIIKNNGITTEEYNNLVNSENEESKKYYARIADDVCMLMPLTVSSFSDFSYDVQYQFGTEEAAYTGLPSDNHNGVIINPDMTAAVFASSRNKEGAAEFLKTLLSDNVQYKSCQLRDYMWAFPVKKSAYDQLFEKERSNLANTSSDDCHGKQIKVKNPDTNTLETINSLIASASKTSFLDSAVRKIINEQTDLYFTGNQSVEETAKNIQNKVSMYLKEIK